MPKNSKNKFINKTLKVIVSEPWDFSSKDGPNIFKAKVVDIFNQDENDEKWLLKSEYKVNMNGVEGIYCFAKTRHQSNHIRELKKGKSVIINLALVPEDKNLDAVNGDDSKAVFVIIGTAKLE